MSESALRFGVPTILESDRSNRMYRMLARPSTATLTARRGGAILSLRRRDSHLLRRPTDGTHAMSLVVTITFDVVYMLNLRSLTDCSSLRLFHTILIKLFHIKSSSL